MQRALSTHLFANHRLTTVWLERIWNGGIPLVEIFCARQHLDYRDKAQISELGHWFRDAQLKLHSLHSPMYTDDVWGRSGPNSIITITEPVKSKRLDMVDEIKRALEIAETVPFRYLIQHLGVAWEEYDERKIDYAFSALEEINLFARQRGVEVLLENTPNELAGAERLLMFLNVTHLNVNVYFDVGHAHMRGSVENEYLLLKPRIRSTHVHDNNGTDDSHLFPGKGTVDWARAMDLLRSADGQYPLLLELREVDEMQYPVESARATFDYLEGLKSLDENHDR
ncbi:MAG TPA: sugar phosphate isomerase/epimerase family protein [Bryobacteraceae bacterium]|nr:sugar phosphate isomerase/epimerase family protein [Bryobacteraceae bacterium]